MQMAIELDLNAELTILLLAVSAISLFWSIFIIWNNTFFAIVWIDEFGIQCENFHKANFISHTKYCLKNYENLQKSLGIVNIVHMLYNL